MDETYVEREVSSFVVDVHRVVHPMHVWIEIARESSSVQRIAF
jgi:hypothetical protein